MDFCPRRPFPIFAQTKLCKGEKRKTYTVYAAVWSAQQVSNECTHNSPPPLLSISWPGSQIYHSVVCILVQFLMLRLMGRTVTNVLSSFTFQMVSRFCLSTLVHLPTCPFTVAMLVANRE